MLTPQREAFAAGLASGMTQAGAYRAAFPKSATWQDATVWKRSGELAADGAVLGRVAELTSKAAAKNEVTVERVVAELARLAFFDARKLFDDTGAPLPIGQLDDDTARAIIGLDVARVGNDMMGIGEILKFKLADKGANLERLGKYLKMFTDRVELTGNMKVTDATTRAARVAHLMAVAEARKKGNSAA